MNTYGELFLDELNKAVQQLQSLTHDYFEPDSIRDLISKVGANAELFLKSVLLPGESSKKNSVFFIDALPSESIDLTGVKALHELRLLYNKAKHTPEYQIDLLSTLDVLLGAGQAFRQVIDYGLGLSKTVRPPSIKRVYWISACDYYTSGETEIHIHIPGDACHYLGVPSFDHVNIKGTKWDEALMRLSQAGHLRMAKGIIPDSQYRAFVTDRDSLEPRVFEGVYRDLLAILTSYELRVAMPGLRREDNPWSIFLAILMAACDLVQSSRNCAELAAKIQLHAVQEYGVPAECSTLPTMSDGIIELFSQVPCDAWTKLRGPIWLKEATFHERSEGTTIRHPVFPLAISSTHEVMVQWG